MAIRLNEQQLQVLLNNNSNLNNKLKQEFKEPDIPLEKKKYVFIIEHYSPTILTGVLLILLIILISLILL